MQTNRAVTILRPVVGNLAVMLLCANALAVEPPAGTVLPLNNVGHFDGSQNLLETCVALLNSDGSAQLDANGQPRVYEVQLGLDRATLQFRVLLPTPFDRGSGMDCSGIFRDGVYTDTVLITNLAPAYNGKVWNITLDYIADSNLEFQLRLDSSFSAVRNFNTNTTELGAALGDFAQDTTRNYGSANLPATLPLALPQCSDADGDDARVILVRDGEVLGSFPAGITFPWSTTGLGVGAIEFSAYCSDEFAIRTLAEQAGVDFFASYAATSAIAPGTLRIHILEGSVDPEPVAGEILFDFAATTSVEDQDLIRATALFARDFLHDTFGLPLQKNTLIRTLGQAGGCSNAGASAFTGAQFLTFCTSNRGWTDHGPVVKRKILIHELFHLLQFERSWLGRPAGSISGPHWLIEGAAEYVGWLGIAAHGDLTLDTAHGCMLKEVADFADRQPPGLPNLSSLETAQSFSNGPVYPLAMIGTKQLVDRSSVAALLDYGEALAAGSAWEAAFSASFGFAASEFYAQFPAYKAGLGVPAGYACRL